MRKPCKLSECNSPVYGHGLCSKHWQRLRRNGDFDLHYANQFGPMKPAIDRFWGLVEKTTSCWIWKGHLNWGGYGKFRAHGKNGTLAHRFSYEHFVGNIPKGLVLDHLCRTPACVNPDHLEPVTRYENTVTRGKTSWSSVNSKKTHCNRGHELSGDNVYYYPKDLGYRHCKKCKYITNKQSLERRAAS